jgi:hypothetical protein
MITNKPLHCDLAAMVVFELFQDQKAVVCSMLVLPRHSLSVRNSARGVSLGFESCDSEMVFRSCDKRSRRVSDLTPDKSAGERAVCSKGGTRGAITIMRLKGTLFKLASLSH